MNDQIDKDVIDMHVLQSFVYFWEGRYESAIKENVTAKLHLKYLLGLPLKLPCSRMASVPPSRPPTKSFRTKSSRLTKCSRFLPDELIEEILSWLPTNILMRFKCLSKKWHSLISNSYFLKLHKKRSRYAKTGENHETRLRMFLENQNYTAAHEEICSYDKFLKTIVKGFTFHRRARGSVLASLSRRGCHCFSSHQ
ncbi:hypothetical protein V8G54_029305 [Vigna mungo]|uniref:F-box domain-containing protein n=1 Tax=Vigna mungo TaxID=3915 RepID=A0AAQ3MV12_VIGMU